MSRTVTVPTDPSQLAPNGNRSSGAYGTITTTYDPRIIQFGFKASF